MNESTRKVYDALHALKGKGEGATSVFLMPCEPPSIVVLVTVGSEAVAFTVTDARLDKVVNRGA